VASHRADQVFYQTRTLNLAALVFAALMVTAALFTVRRSIADPLTALAGVMRQLAVQDMDVDIVGRERGDEIGAMARAVEVFRLNAIDLAISQRTLADHASMLTGELEREQRLTAMQRNFLTMASHELRTPLTHIDGHAQRMVSKADQLGADDVRTRARAIRSDVQRITALIEDLIDRARLADAGPNSVLDLTPFDLVDMLREVCAFHRNLLQNLFIQERYDCRPIMITADPRLLNHVFNNLISNSVKYARGNPRITISTRCCADRVEISVADQGIGIPADELDRVFDRHFRASNIVGMVGTGLGLFIVKTLVELHHGTVAVTSQTGQGTTFLITLPC
jgi:signal transduction histidine kinase